MSSRPTVDQARRIRISIRTRRRVWGAIGVFDVSGKCRPHGRVVASLESHYCSAGIGKVIFWLRRFQGARHVQP